jgi:L-threonylcarbamoyladenylate synthase
MSDAGERPRTVVVTRGSTREAVRLAVETLGRGEVVAFPTDTVYGIAANATDPEAVRRLFAAKGRPSDKPLPILLADGDDLDRVADPIPAAARLLARCWPGPLTLVVPLAPHAGLCPEVTAGLDTIGVRVPDHDLARAVLRAAEFPVAVTSANLSGEREAMAAAEVADALGESVSLILDGGRCSGGVPSTVVDVTVSPPAVLREGAIPMSVVIGIAMPYRFIPHRG